MWAAAANKVDSLFAEAYQPLTSYKISKECSESISQNRYGSEGQMLFIGDF